MTGLHRIVAFVPWNDGRGTVIRAQADDGATVDVDVPFDGLADVISGLIQGCIASARGPLVPPETGLPMCLPTVEARGIGVAATGEGKTSFVVDLAACLIAFFSAK
jgi:hypothetical protein